MVVFAMSFGSINLAVAAGKKKDPAVVPERPGSCRHVGQSAAVSGDARSIDRHKDSRVQRVTAVMKRVLPGVGTGVRR